MKEKSILSIDLKSFFASVECIKLGLDPFTTPIVVANSHQGNGAITLAITPFLKSQGIKSRCRLYEIPDYINYKVINPDMDSYKLYSKKVVDIYLEFIDEKDLHIYSIDECFLDVTNYLKLYKSTDEELAKKILNTILERTGLCATCGIGSSIFLAKVAMDIEAKNNDSFIAKYTLLDIKTKLWNIDKLDKVWGIGPALLKKLNNLSIYTGYDLAHYDKNILKSKLGVIGETLHNNFNGIYTDSISTYNELPKGKSYSHSAHLLKNYDETDILPVFFRMCETLSYRLQQDNVVFKTINFKLTYDSPGKIFKKTLRLDNYTNKSEDIYNNIVLIFNLYYEYLPIRKVDIHLMSINSKEGTQLSLFNKDNSFDESYKYIEEINKIKDKFGKDSISKASLLLDTK